MDCPSQTPCLSIRWLISVLGVTVKARMTHKLDSRADATQGHLSKDKVYEKVGVAMSESG